jgi:putative glutamine amidotransferase
VAVLIQDIPAVVEKAVAHDEDDGNPPARHVVRNRGGQSYRRLAAQSQMQVNSYHHQAVQKPAAISAGSFANDGVIEAVEDTTGRFVLGVQWHPERGWRDDDFSKALFAKFIEHARLRYNQRT